MLGCPGVFVCGWAFSSCGEQGLLSSCGAQVLGGRVSVVAACELSSFSFQALEDGLCSCGAWA